MKDQFSSLISVFHDPSIEEITVDDLNQYPVIRYGTPSGFYIDLIVKLGEFASFDTLESEVVHLDGVPIRVATPETLYKLKHDTLRLRDQADALFLEELIRGRRSRDESTDQ